MGAKVSNYDKEERKFLSRSMNAPLLSKEQEQSLTKLWQKNKDPKERVRPNPDDHISYY